VNVDGQQGGGGVNVAQAKKEFNDLQRNLSRQSSLRRQKSRNSEKGQANFDPEKGGDHGEEFNLLEYLSQSDLGSHPDSGFKFKALGVSWVDHSVVGAGGIKLNIRTFPDAFKELLFKPLMPILMKLPKFKPSPKTILHNFNGHVNPGETCLVLGRPGSGCSTFLKTISNEREGYLAINGNVYYEGIEATEFKKIYNGEALYNPEDDMHMPTLTVGQTLRFALSLKTPGKRLPGQSLKEFREEVLDLLLKMLNIPHTKNTLVGNAEVRGVSGGERKRVSIAEMMTARPAIASWDNTTKGLDASTALDYAKSIRILTDVFHTTSFVSLYQAGEGVYEQFDKVLVIDSGREVFFGPRTEARQYFISLGFADLPRQTTADYLTGCTDVNERKFQEGRDASNVPSTPEQLEKAFKESKYYQMMLDERAAYQKNMESDTARREAFLEAFKAEKRKAVKSKSQFTVSFPTQVMELTKRAIRLQWQDRLGLIVLYATSIIIAIFVGSCYLNLPQSAAGAFTRGGVLFLALLFPAFTAFSQLPTQMMGRPIMWRQTGYTLYRPAALGIASILADLPFSSTNNFLFSLIIYFMTGLARTPGAFFTFYLYVWSAYLALATFFRFLGSLCSSYDVAARLASVIVSAFVLYSGYLIPVFSMKRWLFWIYYINPVQFAFSAVMINEFKRITLACNGAYIAPSGAGYPDTLGDNQVCTLAGSTPGQPNVPGSDYIQASFEYAQSTQWRNWGIVIVFFVGFAIMQCLAMEFFKHGRGAPAITVYQPENKERKALNEKLQANKEKFRAGEAEQDLSALTTSKKPFTWESVCYDVPVSGGQKRLLDNVFGYVKPGTLTALMGSSGAGKTTLLDVLASRKTVGVISGDLLVNGRPQSADFQRGTAYVEQLDQHEHTATVREALRFSAYLRQDASISKAEKDAYVEDVIQLLELEDDADAMIGFPGFGLSVEARKRVTIGVELAAKPQLLLFLDEPTSGLDGQSAYNLVRFLRKLAAAGQAILCTIHQPNAVLFENFDRLLLLKSGGRTVYFGDIGKDSHVIREYFARQGAHCPPNANPAEYMLEAIGAGSKRRVGNKDWADRWLESEEFNQVKREIKEINQEAQKKEDHVDPNASKQYATPFWTQMKIVGKRTTVAFYRNPDYEFTRLFNHISISLFTSLTFLMLGNNLVTLQYRVFDIFIATVMPAIIITQVEPMYIMSRVTFTREASSRMYSPYVFSAAQLFAESPYSVLCAFAYWVLMWYPSGFNRASDRAGYAFFMILVTEFYSVALGQAIGALSPSIFIASTVNPFLLVIFSLFCGVTIPQPQLPGFWREWMYNLDPFTRLISGLVTTELHDLYIYCEPQEFRTFTTPAGQTCEQWAGAFVQSAGGYLEDPNATGSCNYCQYRVGDDFTRSLNISFDDRWRDLGIFIAFFVFNCIITLIASRYLRYARR